MAHICQVHPYEAAEGLCRSCGGPFCADCLVYPFGPLKPPFCVPCAVTAGGVRSNARNRTVVVPKETKRRLKEWRKARKRDLDSPPPDGVATWQKMDEAEADAAEDAEDAVTAKAEAEAEREALRLPPPVPETPTPPPGVNLAPPGPPGSDWRDEIAVPDAEDVRPPWSGFDLGEPSVPASPTIAGESALGVGWAGGDSHASTTTPGDLPAPPEPAPAPAMADVHDEPVPEPIFGGEPTGPRPEAPRSVEIDPEPIFGQSGFEPTPFEPDAAGAPLVVEFDADPLASFGLGAGGSAGPLPPPPPAEGEAFDPLPPPPVVAPFESIGVPPPAPAPAAVTLPPTRAAEASAPPTRRVAPAAAAIRPPTPTRIPAAKPEAPKVNDAKAMLARIAALRGDKDD